MNETALKIKVMKYLKSLPYSIWFKISDRFTSGIPDIIGCYKHRFVAIELKSPKGTIKPIQLAFINKIKKKGGCACIARGLTDVEKLINAIDIDDRHFVKFIVVEK